MILLLGGTTEGKQTAAFLDAQERAYIYSTRSETSFEGKGRYRHGALDVAGLRELCITEKVTHIIDACHPFALELHLTVATLGNELPLIRFEREYPKSSVHPLVTYVDDYRAALSLIAVKGYPSMIALTGVQSIPQLRHFWQQHPCWVRILDRESSISAAAGYHFPAENLLLGLPQDREGEIKLFNELRPGLILSKENGTNGKITAKIEAAIACNIPIIIIKKPALSPIFTVVRNMEDLLMLLDHV